MRTPNFDCSCDVVLDLERLDVGVDEILMYSNALLTTRDLIRLFSGVKEMLETRESSDEDSRVAA